MANIYISEFVASDKTPSGKHFNGIPAVALPPVAEQALSISGTSAQSSAFGSTTTLIRVTTDSTCSILVGSNPTATTSNLRLSADAVEYFYVKPGDKLAGITNT